MKKLITMLIAVLIVSMSAAEWFSPSDIISNPAEPDQNKEYTWHTYGGTSTYNYRTVNERAMLVNAEDFGFNYPVNFNGVQAYLNDVGITSSYRIYARDGVTLLWQSDDFTTTEQGYEIVSPAAPIVLNDDFYIAHIPYLPGDGYGYPSIILDAGDGTHGHSFYGTAGNWTSRDPYAYKMYVALEQYTGADVNPPSVRTIYGGNAFKDYDANIVLAVTDESSITTITGAYTVDGGVNWLNVDLTAAKANYYEFTGTIPGQPDGTEGEVVFFVSDDQGNPETTSVPFPLSWSIDNPLYSQGFEGAFPPAGWSTAYTGDGFIQVDGSDPIIEEVHSGNYAAAHLYVAADQDDWLISPRVSIPADNSSTLTFWQNNVYTSYYELHEVAVSTDMVNWTTIYTDVPTVDNVWEKIYVSLSSYLDQDIYFGFHYTGYDCDNWYVDDFEVLYDYEGPTVEDLVGNEALYPIVGAFLNNDMPISVTVNDLSGVQSVMGHYSFDEGVTVVDLSFTKAKGGDELWTAVIPQLAAVDSGYINFDMVDIGGIAAPTSADYRIDFVRDGDIPVFNYLKGTMAFVNDPLDVEISFSDESAISSCSGYYSPNGVSYSRFDMSPSKIHDYSYVGQIPASAVEIFDGQVYFVITDVEGNTLTSDNYTVQWRDGQNTIVEDFESGDGNWTLTGNWAVVAEGEYTSASNALTESPGGDYESDEVTTAQWAVPFDMSLYPGASLAFWTKFDLEDGFDYMYFEGSKDGGTTWIRLATYNGEGIGWHEEVVAMDAFAGQANVTFRFLFESDGGYETNGMYIDDLILTTYNVDWSAPTIISDPYAPKFYEGVVGDYTDAVEVVDYSGLAGVAVYYSIDGGAEEMVLATNTTGDFYEFTIPTQSAGSQIDYRIYALDASAQSNEGYSKYYSYVAGDHMIYDTGIVSFYTTIEDNASKAVRVTVPGSDESKTIMTGKLAYILFRNYADGSHTSATMQVHVWDDNAGLPGAELITPFDVESEATTTNTSAMTRVDMRSYDLTVSGDFWIGFSAPYGTVYLTRESTDPAHASQTEIGSIAFGRSYTAAWDPINSIWNWSQNALDNWHFRAVLDGIYTGIEDETTPFATELMQNYPNPFNPATTINFSLAKDTKVSLVVYDVMGREVANLVNKNMVSGAHAVTFDASRLVSGVYYYTLKAGEVNQTRKMMLIK